MAGNTNYLKTALQEYGTPTQSATQNTGDDLKVKRTSIVLTERQMEQLKDYCWRERTSISVKVRELLIEQGIIEK